jgi:hypothetical protein
MCRKNPNAHLVPTANRLHRLQVTLGVLRKQIIPMEIAESLIEAEL